MKTAVSDFLNIVIQVAPTILAVLVIHTPDFKCLQNYEEPTEQKH